MPLSTQELQQFKSIVESRPPDEQERFKQKYNALDTAGKEQIVRKGLAQFKPVETPTPEAAPEKSTMLTDPLETLRRSGGDFVSSIVQSVSHPIKTAKTMGELALGVVEKAIPGEQHHEQVADAMGNYFAERYGGPENVQKTALEDPVGFASDLSVFFTGGGSALTKAGTISKVGTLAKTGEALTKVGQMVDPIGVTMKAGGAALESATKGRTIGASPKSLNNPVVDAAKRLNVDLLASAQSNSRVPAILEATAAKGLFGKQILQRVDDIQRSLMNIGEDMIKQTGKADDLGVAGEAISKGAEKFRDRFFTMKEELYKKAEFNSRGAPIIVDTKKTQDFIKTIMDEKIAAHKTVGRASGTDFFEGLQERLSSKDNPINAVEARAAIRELNKKIGNINDPVSTGNKAELQKLASSLSDDLDNAVKTQAPELAKDIDRANRFFKLSLEEMNSHFGKQIMKYSDQPDKILPAIIKDTTSVNDIKRIYRLIGKANKTNVQAAFLRDFLDGAKNPARTYFTPDGLSRQINKFGNDKLAKVLEPEQVQKLNDLAVAARGMGKFERIAEGSQTAFTGRLLAEFTPLLHGDVLKTGLILMGDRMLSHWIASKSGQQFILRGVTLTGKTGKAIQKAAPKAAAAGRTARIGGLASEEDLND
jgi:hypothetical protein